MKKIIALAGFAWLLSGCQMGYIIQNGYHQVRMLNSGVPVDTVLADPKVDEKIKNKLVLVTEAKAFAESRLKLKKTKNYKSYVTLDGPYVTYIVAAAPKNELKYYTWYFPIVGSVPYKGYFIKEKADREAQELEAEGYDVYVRGVTAYSTLGWFKDPVLSSMMGYTDYDLVNTIIHETVHATLYIADNANFNERLATYLGDLGSRLFYEDKKKDLTKVLEEVKLDLEDQATFSAFISERVKILEQWYKDHGKDADVLTTREEQFHLMQEDFKKSVLPKLKTGKYKKFADVKINNARLLGFKLYMNDLTDFEKLTAAFNGDFEKILDYCRSLAKSKDPEKTLKEFIQAH